MKLKNKLVGLGIGVALTSGIIISLPKLTELSKVYANTGSQQETNSTKKQSALKVALLEFSSLEDFNNRFGEESDGQWMIPDLSSRGSEDGGKTHGWTITASEEVALKEASMQEEPQNEIEGASVSDIRKALYERDAKENPAIKTALNEYASLEEFNKRFSPIEDTMTASYTPNEQWMIPDLSSLGSNDGGKSHGWQGAPTREQAQDSDVTDEKGNVFYTFKVSDGASAGAIREALVQRDKTNK